jgi:hypothetical protein
LLLPPPYVGNRDEIIHRPFVPRKRRFAAISGICGSCCFGTFIAHIMGVLYQMKGVVNGMSCQKSSFVNGAIRNRNTNGNGFAERFNRK